MGFEKAVTDSRARTPLCCGLDGGCRFRKRDLCWWGSSLLFRRRALPCRVAQRTDVWSRQTAAWVITQAGGRGTAMDGAVECARRATREEPIDRGEEFLPGLLLSSPMHGELRTAPVLRVPRRRNALRCLARSIAGLIQHSRSGSNNTNDKCRTRILFNEAHA